METKPVVEYFISSDGKHAVHVQMTQLTNEAADKSFELASYIYDMITSKYASKMSNGHKPVQQKLEANYGNCEKCGAELVKNPKTGKVFCSAKCWLN